MWFLALLACGGEALSAQPNHAASEDNVFALAKQVHAGDRVTIRTLLSLEVDGAAAEDVTVLMGGVIRTHPRVFLEEVSAHGRAHCERCLDSFLVALGDDFVDRPQLQVEELSKRREALRSVDSPALLAFRDRCIAILDAHISNLQSLSKERIAKP